MNTYVYEGPLFDSDGRTVESNAVVYTQARTHKEAVRNIRYKIGLTRDLIPSSVRLLITDYKEVEPNRYCKDCGMRLNDSGRCPICQDSEYSILDAMYELRDTEEGLE